MAGTTYARVLLRRDSAADWNSEDPVLANGEIGIDLTTYLMKIGNGADPWTALSYVSSGGQQVVGSGASPEPVSEPIAAPTSMNSIIFAIGDSGPVTISNIGTPPAVGARVDVFCTSNVNTITLDGAGNLLVNGGSLTLGSGGSWEAVWDGTSYRETGRN